MMLVISWLNTFTCVAAWYVPSTSFTTFVTSCSVVVGSMLVVSLYIDRIFTDCLLRALLGALMIFPPLTLYISEEMPKTLATGLIIIQIGFKAVYYMIKQGVKKTLDCFASARNDGI